MTCCLAVLPTLPTQIFRPLVEKLAVMSPDDKANFRMEDVPGIYPIHYAHIQRLYADQGITMVDLLKKNPAVAVPVILLRLEQKAEEWWVAVGAAVGSSSGRRPCRAWKPFGHALHLAVIAAELPDSGQYGHAWLGAACCKAHVFCLTQASLHAS